MWEGLAALCLSLSQVSSPAAVAAPDSNVSERIVRRFDPIVVEGGRRADPSSIETVYTLPARSLRALPLDRFADAIALEAGVVAQGEDLHVRGGRSGELRVSAWGMPLNDPQTGAAFELPLLAVRSADLLAGGLDADHAGSLSGELDVQTEVPGDHVQGLARWSTDGRVSRGYDAGLARLTGPLAHGIGFAMAGEARLDDLGLPVTRTLSRREVLGANFGWRQDNHLLAWLKLAPVEAPQRASVEVFASRAVRAPYNPMFTYDAYVTPTGASDSAFPFTLTPEPVDETSVRYRAADHLVMSDERRLAVLATRSVLTRAGPARATLGWLHGSSLTSIGLRDDSNYINDNNRLEWGLPHDADSDPFSAYFGDQPYFRRSRNDRWFGRGDLSATPAPHQRVKVGLGMNYDAVELREIDDVFPSGVGFDSLRTYHAVAPGGFAYAQHRWELGGLIWNAGMRLQMFNAGSQADGHHTIWTWSPRLGFAYPVSVKDAFSASYSRVHQDPERDLLYDQRRVGFNRHPMGNGALIPAEVISYQAAVKHILDVAWSLQLGVFYRDVFGEPGARRAVSPPGTFRLEYQSADESHAGGVEFAVRRESESGQRVTLGYTFMDAYGSQSSPDGLDFGYAVGDRTLPDGTHALDWDVRHAVTFTALLHAHREWSLSWSTRAASGTPWTPVPHATGASPPPFTDQTLVNSRRLPWSENTDVAVRWSPKFLFGAKALLHVANLFDQRGDNAATISGYPNPSINTFADQYSAYRTETGLGGGAYWDPSVGNPGGWIPVHDARLETPRRSIRVGLEYGR